MAARRKRRTTRRDTSSAAILLPSVRTYRTWSPAQLRQAEASADNGYIRTAVDICDWILADERVRGCIDARLNGFLELPLSFEASGDKRRSNRAVKALEAGEDWWAMFPNPDARLVLAWALVLGTGPGVMRWSQLEGHEGRDIPVLQFFHPQPMRYDWQQRTWLRQVENAGVEEPIAFGDGVWFAHQPFGAYRPWAMGWWRGLARWVLLKAYAISDYGRLGESATKQVIEIDKEAKSSGTQRKELAADLDRMGREQRIVLPPGYSYKLVEASAATKDLFDKQIRLADNAIAIAIRGGNLTTQVDGGSRAAAEVQERGGDLANRKSDAGAWSETTRSHGLTWWAGSNFGDRQLAPWAVYATDPEEDRKEKAETMNLALNGAEKAEALGFDVDRKAFADTFSLGGFLKPGEKREPEPDPAPGSDDDDEERGGSDRGNGKGKARMASEGSGATKNARPRSLGHRLASAAQLRGNEGFLSGQLYADALVDAATVYSQDLLEETRTAIEEELDRNDDYESLRAALRKRYPHLPHETLAELVQHHLVIATLAGVASVNDDAAGD